MKTMEDRVKQQLRQHGMQVTAQRLATMRAVSSHPHASADELTEDVRAVIGSISRQAVYDSLGLLVEKNLIRRIQPSGSSARYEDRVGDNHHHLICRSCGRVVDIECAVGSAPCLTPLDDRGYEIDEAEVAYWGRCPACVEQSRTSLTAITSRLPGSARPGSRRTAPAKAPPGPPTPTESTPIPRSNHRPARRSSRG